MSFLNLFKRKKKEEENIFLYMSKLMKENNELREEIGILNRALSLCSFEVYKCTGNLEHGSRHHWVNFVKNIYYSPLITFPDKIDKLG